ncbi:MAG: energy transducer TonB [Bacteroidota bacterium]
MTRETAFGWTGSIVFHVAAGFMLFFVRPPQPEVQQQEFVEFSFGGGVASSFGPMPKGDALPEGTAPPPLGQTGVAATGVGVDLPTAQNSLPSDEIVNARPTKKLEANDNPVAIPGERKGMADVQREAPPSSAIGFPGGKEDVVGKPGIATGSDVAPPFNAGGVGNSIGNNISYNVQWAGGRIRNLISGDLPKYPPDVNVEAQIKLRVVVQPRGTVKSIQPLQKGNTRLENAAIKEVRLWRFQSLQSAQPALDQVCTIIFNFKMK